MKKENLPTVFRPKQAQIRRNPLGQHRKIYDSDGLPLFRACLLLPILVVLMTLEFPKKEAHALFACAPYMTKTHP